jgi:hypothetical protein
MNVRSLYTGTKHSGVSEIPRFARAKKGDKGYGERGQANLETGLGIVVEDDSHRHGGLPGDLAGSVCGMWRSLAALALSSLVVSTGRDDVSLPAG